MKILQLIENIFLAGSHIIMVFVFGFLVWSVFNLNIVNILALIVSFGLAYGYVRYNKHRKVEKNKFFSYLSILLICFYIVNLFGNESAIIVFEAIEGIFSQFILVVGAFFFMLSPLLIIILITYIILRKNTILFWFVSATVLIVYSIFNPQIPPELIRKITFFLAKYVKLYLGGVVLMHLHYLYIKHDYSSAIIKAMKHHKKR